MSLGKRQFVSKIFYVDTDQIKSYTYFVFYQNNSQKIKKVYFLIPLKFVNLKSKIVSSRMAAAVETSKGAKTKTPLAINGFTEFPDHFQFPPFFTLQPNQETRAKQLSIWVKLIKNFCEKTRSFTLEKNSELFTNKQLVRSLPTDSIIAIFDEMVRISDAEYVNPPSKDRVYIWWQSKDTWSKKLMTFAEKNGLLNSVATIYELHNENKEFEGMDEPMLISILKMLESKGKCELMTSGAGVEGVKFFM